MTNLPRRSRLLAASTTLSLIVGASLLAAGCGSDDDAAPSTTGAAAPAKRVSFSGAPVTIYTLSQLKTPVGDLSEIPAAARAGAAAINAAGGLDGHEVKVVACNDTDANAELACARKAIAGKAIAFVGSAFTFNGAAAQALLTKAGIANVAPLAVSPAEYAVPVNFLIDGATFGAFTCPGAVARQAGAKKIGFVAQNFPVQKQLGTALEGVSAAQGLEFTGSVYTPANQSDFASTAQGLTSEGAQVVSIGLTPAAVPGFLQAASATGSTYSKCLIPPAFSVDALAKLGSAASGIYVGSGLPPVSSASKYPLVKRFVTEMEAAEQAGDEDADLTIHQPTNALRSWLGMHIVGEAAKRVDGELTAKTLFKALNGLQVDLGGVTPPLDFAKPNPAAPFARVFNGQVRLLEWDAEEKQLVDTDSPPADALKLLGAAG